MVSLDIRISLSWAGRLVIISYYHTYVSADSKIIFKQIQKKKKKLRKQIYQQ